MDLMGSAVTAILRLLQLPRGARGLARPALKAVARSLVKYGWQPGSPWLDVALATALWENLDNHADIVRAAAPAVSPPDAAAAPPAGDVDGPGARPAWRLHHRGSTLKKLL